jgi:transposase
VWEWITAFNEGGIEGLHYVKPSGPRSRLTDVEKEQLKADVLAGPRSRGYDFSNWDGKSLSHHIDVSFNVKLGVRAVQKQLINLGLTRQKPDVEYAKANPDAQVQFKLELKKRSTK